MNLQSLPALLASIVTFAIGAAVALREPLRARRLFSVFALAIASWLLATFLYATLGWEAAHLAALLAALTIPILAYRFSAVFVAQIAGEAEDPTRPLEVTPRWMIPLAAAFLVTLVYAALFGPRALHHAPLFQVLFGAYLYGGLVSAALLANAAYRRTLGRTEKARLRYLFVGGLVAIALSAYDAFSGLGGLGFRVPTTGYVFTVTYMYFVSQALFRHGLLDLNEVLGRMAVLAAFVLLLSTIYGLLVAWVPAQQTGLFFFNSIVASLVIFILFEPLRGVIEGPIQGWLFRERWALRAAIDRARAALANTIDLHDAVATALRNLEDSRRVTHAAVYLLDRDGAGYDLHGWIGPRPVERIDAAARRPLLERLQLGRPGARGTSPLSPVSIEQLEREQSGHPDGEAETLDAIARALVEMKAALCLPLVSQEEGVGQIVGLLCVRDERLRDAFASDEIERLRGLAAQLAIAVKNSKLYDRMKERDRLAALGEMAAGLAHEIRNPLGAIKGAAQLLLPSEGGAAAEAGEFLGIIVEESNRLNRVVSQFLDYARPFKATLEPLDLNEIVRKTVQLLPPQLDVGPRATVALELGEVPPTRGDAEQLRQVFLNLAINAIQAMPDGGALTISTATQRARDGSAVAVVRFADTGRGIPALQLKNLFIPFFTTKDKGIGLGLPISQRIVEHHGGRIEVRSREGAGSTFSVVLPARGAPAP